MKKKNDLATCILDGGQGNKSFLVVCMYNIIWFSCAIINAAAMGDSQQPTSRLSQEGSQMSYYNLVTPGGPNETNSPLQDD